jgi:hypothetical protein
MSKYSYLLLQKRHNSIIETTPFTWSLLAQPLVGTGFFVRKNKRVFLVSAKHVLTNFDCYPMVTTEGYERIIYVRYVDTLNYVKFQPINTSANWLKERGEPCFVVPDIDFVEVTGLFADAKLNIVDIGNVSDSIGLTIDSGTSFYLTGFGISGTRGVEMQDYFLGATPIGYEAQSQPNCPDPIYARPSLITYYYFLNAYMEKGTSGSPVFILKKKRGKPFYEFVGIQSASDSTYNFSYVVKKQALLAMLP